MATTGLLWCVTSQMSTRSKEVKVKKRKKITEKEVKQHGASSTTALHICLCMYWVLTFFLYNICIVVHLSLVKLNDKIHCTAHLFVWTSWIAMVHYFKVMCWIKTCAIVHIWWDGLKLISCNGMLFNLYYMVYFIRWGWAEMFMGQNFGPKVAHF